MQWYLFINMWLYLSVLNINVIIALESNLEVFHFLIPLNLFVKNYNFPDCEDFIQFPCNKLVLLLSYRVVHLDKIINFSPMKIFVYKLSISTGFKFYIGFPKILSSSIANVLHRIQIRLTIILNYIS